MPQGLFDVSIDGEHDGAGVHGITGPPAAAAGPEPRGGAGDTHHLGSDGLVVVSGAHRAASADGVTTEVTSGASAGLAARMARARSPHAPRACASRAHALPAKSATIRYRKN